MCQTVAVSHRGTETRKRINAVFFILQCKRDLITSHFHVLTAKEHKNVTEDFLEEETTDLNPEPCVRVSWGKNDGQVLLDSGKNLEHSKKQHEDMVCYGGKHPGHLQVSGQECKWQQHTLCVFRSYKSS